ncbi:chromobox protein homolog 2-like isoform X2 [Paramacrobiotus metropolitanus]|uniref:chromobox protein homolog 2-like isoform X2 n=1 Tax=Paramacrobiotus metropolitanus TaxID=2943436 RepID=UPI00244585B4|nr:chromobox protein homolog 2-like isoform X2 [Paramacrobiotus metropolitanus]
MDYQQSFFILAVAEDNLASIPLAPVRVQAPSKPKSGSFARSSLRPSLLPRQSDQDARSESDDDECEVECVRDKKVTADGCIKYYVKWAGYPDSESSWVPASNMKNARSLVRKYEQSLQQQQQNKKCLGSVAKNTSKTPSASKSASRDTVAKSPAATARLQTVASPEVVPVNVVTGAKNTFSSPCVPAVSHAIPKTEPVFKRVKRPSIAAVPKLTLSINSPGSAQPPPSSPSIASTPSDQPEGSGQSDTPSQEQLSRKRKAKMEATDRLKLQAALDSRWRNNILAEPSTAPTSSKSVKSVSSRSDTSSGITVASTSSSIEYTYQAPPPDPSRIRVIKNGGSGIEMGKLAVNVLGHKPANLRIRTLSDVEFLVNYADHPQEYVPYITCIERIPNLIAEYLARVPVLLLNGAF